MIQEIECPGKYLEKFILRAEQISYYNDVSGEPDKKLVRNKQAYEELTDYYHKAKQLAKLFAEEKDYENMHHMILRRLKYHIIICPNCAKEKKELEIKYKNLHAELEKLTKAEKANLRSFGLLEGD